jgi:hypothetical protein
MKKKILVTVMVCGLMLCSFVLGCAPAPATGEALSPEILVTPANGPLKQKIVVTGSGFAPGENVRLSIIVAGVKTSFGERKAGTVIPTNAEGAFRCAAQLPGGLLEVGVHTITGEGMTSGAQATFPFELTE